MMSEPILSVQNRLHRSAHAIASPCPAHPTAHPSTHRLLLLYMDSASPAESNMLGGVGLVVAPVVVVTIETANLLLCSNYPKRLQMVRGWPLSLGGRPPEVTGTGMGWGRTGVFMPPLW